MPAAPYLKGMTRALPLSTMLALGLLIAPVLMAHLFATPAAAEDERYIIMKPEPGAEPWLAPKYRSPRGTRERVKPVKPAQAPKPPQQTQVPLPLYVPQTGRLLPNLPSAGSGVGGRESAQDRAARCVHQSGVYGALAGDRDTYIRGCINQ